MKHRKNLFKIHIISFKFKVPIFRGAGFTLIELMVAVAVIVVISSVLFVGKSKEDENFNLKMSAFVLSQGIREIQEKALGAENAICPNPSNNPCGFGIRFEQNKDFYTPFIDCSNNCNTSNHKLTGSDLVFANINLGQNVKTCSLPFAIWDLVFSPPDPIIYLNNISWQDGDSEVVLCLKSDPSKTKKIKLNNVGKIEIE